MDIGRKLQQLENRLTAVERSARLSHASLDNAALQVKDDTGGLRGILGVQADGTTAVNIVNGPPPPQPSLPIVASVLGGVAASWDGTFADGSPAPLDWARVEVHASTTAVYDPSPATLQSTIETAQGATVVVPCTTPMYVRLLARNTSGTASTPSDTVGPFGPAVVVASDVLDGIVTTVKLADDAVTQAKVAAGAIGDTEISDNAVTTPKLVAGAVQAGKIAADAVQAGNIAANAVTAREIAALSVTASQLAANSVVAGKIQAGTVDTTSIAANAITTEKIATNAITADKILAGEITGSKLSATAIDGKTITGALLRTNATGQRIEIGADNQAKFYTGHPNETAPGFMLGNVQTDAGVTSSYLLINAPQIDSIAPQTISLSTGTDGTRSASIGGFTVGTWADGTQSATVQGQLSVLGSLSVTDTVWQTWTPTVSGAGSATFSARDGWFYKLGKMVFCQAYIVCSAAGSGTSTVTVALPTTPYRGPSANRRQHLSAYFGGLAAGTNSSTSGHGAGLIQPTGTGALIDQFRGPTDILVRGENLSATCTIAINGWYREA